MQRAAGLVEERDADLLPCGAGSSLQRLGHERSLAPQETGMNEPIRSTIREILHQDMAGAAADHVRSLDLCAPELQGERVGSLPVDALPRHGNRTRFPFTAPHRPEEDTRPADQHLCARVPRNRSPDVHDSDQRHLLVSLGDGLYDLEAHSVALPPEKIAAPGSASKARLRTGSIGRVRNTGSGGVVGIVPQGADCGKLRPDRHCIRSFRLREFNATATRPENSAPIFWT